MTPRQVWDARRSKGAHSDHILCGRKVGSTYPCDAIIARDPLPGLEDTVGGVLWLPAGLTDRSEEGKPALQPGEFRWSRHSLQMIANGNLPAYLRHSDKTRTVDRAQLPIIVPCPRRPFHLSRIDVGLLRD